MQRRVYVMPTELTYPDLPQFNALDILFDTVKAHGRLCQFTDRKQLHQSRRSALLLLRSASSAANPQDLSAHVPTV